MNIAANLTLLDIEASTRLGVVRRGSLGRLAAERLEQFDVRGRPDGKITQLSGGNQQKVILARWLARQPRLLLLDDPTRGVDVGAKSEIHARLRIAAEAGAAIVMSSSELPELLRTCDRIIVMHGGRIAGELDGATATEDGVMALATGLAKAAA
jgi:ABC-type sugar transport system ATPase subunit